MIKAVRLKDGEMFQSLDLPSDSQILGFYYKDGELKLDYFDPDITGKDNYEVALSPVGFHGSELKVPFFTYYGIISNDADSNCQYHVFYRKED
jgi:hypothetical protein